MFRINRFTGGEPNRSLRGTILFLEAAAIFVTVHGTQSGIEKQRNVTSRRMGMRKARWVTMGTDCRY